jgi:large subunit ribosomal protein L29
MKLANVRQYREKLRTQSAEDLSAELLKLRKEQFSLRMQRATGQQPKPHMFSDARRNIARVKTLLRKQQAAKAGGKK